MLLKDTNVRMYIPNRCSAFLLKNVSEIKCAALLIVSMLNYICDLLRDVLLKYSCVHTVYCATSLLTTLIFIGCVIAQYCAILRYVNSANVS